MTGKLHISSSPHIHAPTSVQRIMLDVVLALLPAAAAGVYFFGLRALLLIAVCVSSCVLSEFLFNLIAKKEQTVGDLSAVVTGLILAMNLSVNLPVWQAVVGSVFAIVVVKCFFGGMGCNIVNPAATARVFMLLSFGTMAQSAFPEGVDAVAGATPLVQIANGEVPSLLDLFLGRNGGAIGETGALFLLLGGIYLIARRVITWHIPVCFIGSVFVLSLIASGMNFEIATASILSGGLFIGAIFMATDYVTSPATPWGKVVFGLFAGVITFAIRQWGVYPEGVSFAILLANIVDPYIDIWTARRVFGGEKA
jgi:electron transport complex protein RnfD